MSTGYTDADDPHIKLAELMNREFGTCISSGTVRRFVADYWDRVSWFAHSIHNEVERERAKPTRTPEQALDAIKYIVDRAVPGTTVQRDDINRIIESAKAKAYQPYTGGY